MRVTLHPCRAVRCCCAARSAACPQLKKNKLPIMVRRPFRRMPSARVTPRKLVIHCRPRRAAWPDNAPRLRQVVDDSEMDRMVSEAFVEELGFDVVCAGSGEECVQVRSACATLLLCAVAAPVRELPRSAVRARERACSTREGRRCDDADSERHDEPKPAEPRTTGPPARPPLWYRPRVD